MANDGIVINIDGDASALESSLSSALSGIGGKAKAGLADVKAGIDMATQALSKLAGVAEKGINYNATMEGYQTSFEVMTGSAEKAAEVVERLRTMGAETPFETTDLVQTTQLLMQYGFTADDAIEKMSMLGDIAQGDANKMTSIATGYAQMSSAGKVNLQDVKQMINGGFNPLQEISERTGESMESLYDRISKGTMSVDEITQSMIAATSEGGKFYQSMEKQSQTLNGQLATLQDNANELLGSITSGLSSEIQSDLLPMVNNMIAELQSAFDAGGISGLVNEATAMLPDLIGMMTGKLDDALNGLAKWAPKLADALTSALPSVMNGLSSAVPALTTALFEVASEVVSGLIAMLPELVPALADGVINMLGSVFNGVGTLIDGIFEGIERACHQGQEKIAGVWVNSDNVAEFNFGFDSSLAVENVESAYQKIYDALKASPLTEAQQAEILALIGEDYQTIYDKLIEFGMTPEAAAELAANVTEAGDTIIQAYEGLDVGLDATTLARLTAQSKGSRIVMKGLLKDMGLSDSDIEEVLGVYDECTGALKDGTPSIVSEIYDKLTDHEADTQTVVDSLKEGVEGVVSGLLSDLEQWYNTELAKLDPMAADYAARKEALDTQYNDLKSQITTLNGDMTTLVDTYAGAATSVVEAHMDEFGAVEQRLYDIETRIDGLTEKATDAGEAAFRVVRSGANADTETIETAINFKFTEYKLDEQAAEDAYQAAMDELNQEFANNPNMTKEEYNAKKADIEAEKDAAIEAAKQQYQQALSEIFAGIMESEGNEEALAKLQDSQIAQQLISGMMQTILQGGEVSEEDKTAVSDALSKVLGDSFDPELLSTYIDSYNKTGDKSWATGYLNSLAGDVEEASADDLKTAIGGKVGETYAAALEDGVLEGTSFDTDKDEEQLAAILAGIAQGTDTTAAAQAVTTTATEAISDGIDNVNSDGALTEKLREKNEEIIDEALGDGGDGGEPTTVEPEVEVEPEVVEEEPVTIEPEVEVEPEATEVNTDGMTSEVQQEAQSSIDSATDNLVVDMSPAVDGVEESAKKLVTVADVSSEMKQVGSDIGTGFYNGLIPKLRNAVNSAKRIVANLPDAVKKLLNINSPSRVMRHIGESVGEGFDIGVRTSMEEAVRTAKYMTGKLVTASDITQTTRVNMPSLTQEIKLANEQSSTPVNLDGKQIATIQGHNNSMTIAWNNTRTAKGVGSR